MRKLFLLGAAVLALAVFGCSSNSGSDITGPTGTAALSTTPAPPAPEPIAAPGFYGTVSNLSAAGFTLTSPDGGTLDVTTSPGTMVLFQGSVTDLASSPLENGMKVSVNGVVAGLPENAKVRAILIVINSSVNNRDILDALSL